VKFHAERVCGQGGFFGGQERSPLLLAVEIKARYGLNIRRILVVRLL
jgi:hypothetical protein